MRLTDLFGESPFALLQEHANKVHACVDLLEGLFRHIQAGEFEAAREMSETIVERETEADKIQSHLQEQLATRALVAVDRQVLLHVVEQQDDLADCAEEIAVTATCRPLSLPDTLWPHLTDYVLRTLEACRLTAAIMGRMDLLAESSFQGRDAQTISKLITEVDLKEDALKGMQSVLARRVMGPELELSPQDATLWWHVLGQLGRLGRTADRTAGGVRLMLKG